MKKLTLFALIIAAACSIGYAQTRFKTYDNDRFYFSIEYPADILAMRPPPANNDGRTFRSKDGKVEMRAWGSYNALDRSLSDEYDEALKGLGAGVTYKTLGDNSFVISGIRNGKIFYQKTLFRGGAVEAFYTFTIEYPKSQKAKFDPVVTRISRSFKFDPDADI